MRQEEYCRTSSIVETHFYLSESLKAKLISVILNLTSDHYLKVTKPAVLTNAKLIDT